VTDLLYEFRCECGWWEAFVFPPLATTRRCPSPGCERLLILSTIVNP
jgi:hypothetical protein